ncbi:type 2 lanthipeptide synthetase LanM family protein [Priestia megaterium]
MEPNTLKRQSSIYFKELYKALSLKERYELFQRSTESLNNITLTPKEIESILNDWKSHSLLNDEKMEKKLLSEGLHKEDFAKVLKMSKSDEWMNAFSNEIKPNWMTSIEKALELNRKQLFEEFSPKNITLAFRPFFLWFKEKMNTYLNNNPRLSDLILKESLFDSLLHNLAQGLTSIGARTIVLEMHIAKKLNELDGESPEERYESFINKKLVKSNEIEFIYKEYPVLARILMTRTMFYYNVIAESLDRYQKDYDEIMKDLAKEDSLLVKVIAGMGDSHQKGRTVMRFKFDNQKEIIYKPKSLSIVKHFNNLLKWINQRGFEPQLKGYKSIIHEDYAWEECIIPTECYNQKQVENYYERLGGYLAIIYILNGSDFHNENIIANGEYPLLIDLETLFHHIPELNLEENAQIKAKMEVANSVLGTALLPNLFFKSADGRGVDISGVNGDEQELPIPILRIEKEGTDEMRFVRKTGRTGGDTSNVPKFNGDIANITDYTDKVLKGFKNASNILIENKHELLNDKGPIASFKNVEIRIVNRPTSYYGNFLLESHHPDYMKDCLDKEKLLDRTWFTILDQRPIPYEIKSLSEGDIPMFITKPNSHSLISSDGDIIKDYYKKTSYDLSIEKIKNLSIEIVNKQSGWIKSSLVTNNSVDENIQDCISTLPIDKSVSEINVDMMVLEAKKIGDYLEKNAIYSNYGDAAWIGLETNYYGQWQVTALDNGLYNGLSGIGLFLAYLGKLTNEQKYHDLARKVEKTILLTPVNQKGLISAFHGTSSSLYMFSHFNKIYGENKERNNYMEKALASIELNIKDDNLFDLLGGSAGTIHVLLNLFEQTGNEKALHIAKLCGEHLLRNKLVFSEGTGWPSVTDPKPLGGFSHGTSGIAWSLLRLHSFIKQHEFYEVAIDAIRYDQSLFDNDVNNWKDIRCSDYNSSQHSAAWCHGSAGIGLSRIMYMPYLENHDFTSEIETAISTTLKTGMGKTHCLCHGDLGNVELFLKAGEVLNRKDYHKMAKSIGSSVIAYHKEHNYYKTGVKGHVELPGLMLGVSGIGYQLLRLANPKMVPSVLIFE